MVNTLYWLMFGAVVVYLYILVAREHSRRNRIRRMRRLRERRAWLDSQKPQRWQ